MVLKLASKFEQAVNNKNGFSQSTLFLDLFQTNPRQRTPFSPRATTFLKVMTTHLGQNNNNNNNSGLKALKNRQEQVETGEDSTLEQTKVGWLRYILFWFFP